MDRHFSMGQTPAATGRPAPTPLGSQCAFARCSRIAATAAKGANFPDRLPDNIAARTDKADKMGSWSPLSVLSVRLR